MSQIFVSYRRSEASTAHLLRTMLQERGFSVFLDIEELGRGNWRDQLESKIRNCEDFILLVSKTLETSGHVQREVELALSLKKNIIPVTLSEQTDDGPEWLQQATSFQGTHFDARDVRATCTRVIRLMQSQPSKIGRLSKKNISIIVILLALGAFVSLGIFTWSRQSTSPVASKSSLTRDAQLLLCELGYYQGPLDGVIGPGTAVSVKRFQEKVGLAATGVLDISTMDALRMTRSKQVTVTNCTK